METATFEEIKPLSCRAEIIVCFVLMLLLAIDLPLFRSDAVKNTQRTQTRTMVRAKLAKSASMQKIG